VLAGVAGVVLWPGLGYPQPEIWGWTVLAVALAVNFWVVVHLIRQNGRLLLRIEAIEAQLRMEAELAPPAGLPPGSPAPSFRLNSADGKSVSLEDLRAAGKPVLLVFVQPDCGPCNELMPEIRQWQSGHADRLTLQVVSEDGKRPISDSYQCPATPGAVLVTPDGKVGSPVSLGADQIKGLVQSTRYE
jgi:thiol-disulfide isomerase/thioredoxin